MDNIADLATKYSPTVVIGLIFWRIMAAAFKYHVHSLASQRKDLLEHMRTTCRSAGKTGPLAALALAALVSMPGCTSGQGGTVGDFNLSTPLGNLAFKTWTITPATAAPTTQPVASR